MLENEEGSSEGIGRHPTWRVWVLTVLAAIVLSVAATLLLGGTYDFRAAPAAVESAAGCGGGCCGRGEK